MMPVAILAGGLGTRLGELTEHTPKSLVRVAGHPFIWHQLSLLRAAGVRQVYVLASHMIEQMRRELAHASITDSFHVRVLADKPRMAGTARALRPVAEIVKGPFFVLYGDSFLNCDYELVEQRFRRSKAPALMVVCRTPAGATSNAHVERGFVRRYDKEHVAANMHHIDYGLNVLTPDALNAYPLLNDLPRVHASLSSVGKLAGFIWPERYYSIGSPAGLAETDAVIRSRMPQASK